MLEFFYQSLETLKEVKKPTKDEVIKMTIAVLLVILISAVLFAITDYLFLHLYNDVIYSFLNSIFK